MFVHILAWTCSLAAPSAEDVGELLAAMRRRTNGHDSFVATYTVESPKRKGVLTLTFDSPDRARVRLDADDMKLSTWLLDTRLIVRGDQGGEETHADVDLEPLGDLDRKFDEEFPPRNPSSGDMGPGPVIQLGFEPMSRGSEENSLEVRILRPQRRTALLGWLANSRGWKDARHEGDRLILEPSATSRIALAVESGFIQEMSYPGEHGPVVVKLTTLAVDESLPADTFSIPTRGPGVKDQSEQYQRQVTMSFAGAVRRRLHELANEEGIEDRFGASVLREKATGIAELTHDHLVVDACATWSEKGKANTSEFFRAWRAEYEKAQGDEAALKSLIAVVDEKRAGLVKAVAATRASYQARLEGPKDASSSVATLILECEREGAGRAFDRHVGDVLVAAFDAARAEVVGDG